MNKKVIYIAGASHSGSTLLGCILGSDPVSPFKYFHVGEVHAFFSPDHSKYGRPYGPGREGRKFWKKIDYAVQRQKAYIELFAKSGTHLLVDSSKNLEWLCLQHDVCIDNNWNFQLLITYRPFGGIWDSVKRRKGTIQQNVSNLMYYSHLFKQMEKLDAEVLSVNISDLTQSPAEMTKKLCMATSIPYFPGKENYWNFRHYHLYGAAAQRRHLKNPEDASYYSSSGDCKGLKKLPLSPNQMSELKQAEKFLAHRAIL